MDRIIFLFIYDEPYKVFKYVFKTDRYSRWSHTCRSYFCHRHFTTFRANARRICNKTKCLTANEILFKPNITEHYLHVSKNNKTCLNETRLITSHRMYVFAAICTGGNYTNNFSRQS